MEDSYKTTQNVSFDSSQVDSTSQEPVMGSLVERIERNQRVMARMKQNIQRAREQANQLPDCLDKSKQLVELEEGEEILDKAIELNEQALAEYRRDKIQVSAACVEYLQRCESKVSEFGTFAKKKTQSRARQIIDGTKRRPPWKRKHRW